MKNTEFYKYCPHCGKDYNNDNKSSRVLYCDKCNFNFYQNPVTTVGIVVPVDSGDKVLVSVRNVDPGKGMYEVPGGFLDHGEDLETALVREIDEELGLTNVGIDKYVTSANISYNHGGLTWNCCPVFFAIKPVSRDLIRINDGEIESFDFYNYDEVKKIKDQFAFDVDYIALIKYFDSLQRN